MKVVLKILKIKNLQISFPTFNKISFFVEMDDLDVIVTPSRLRDRRPVNYSLSRTPLRGTSQPVEGRWMPNASTVNNTTSVNMANALNLHLNQSNFYLTHVVFLDTTETTPRRQKRISETLETESPSLVSPGPGYDLIMNESAPGSVMRTYLDQMLIWN